MSELSKLVWKCVYDILDTDETTFTQVINYYTNEWCNLNKTKNEPINKYKKTDKYHKYKKTDKYKKHLHQIHEAIRKVQLKVLDDNATYMKQYFKEGINFQKIY